MESHNITESELISGNIKLMETPDIEEAKEAKETKETKENEISDNIETKDNPINELCDDDCPICYEKMTDIFTTLCKHSMCKRCSKLIVTNICPICRQKMRKRSLRFNFMNVLKALPNLILPIFAV